jgi:hypothetical protein
MQVFHRNSDAIASANAFAPSTGLSIGSNSKPIEEFWSVLDISKFVHGGSNAAAPHRLKKVANHKYKTGGCPVIVLDDVWEDLDVPGKFYPPNVSVYTSFEYEAQTSPQSARIKYTVPSALLVHPCDHIAMADIENNTILFGACTARAKVCVRVIHRLEVSTDDSTAAVPASLASTAPLFIAGEAVDLRVLDVVSFEPCPRFYLSGVSTDNPNHKFWSSQTKDVSSPLQRNIVLKVVISGFFFDGDDVMVRN